MAAKPVRIKSCRDSQYWYANSIGRWYALHHVDAEYVWVIDNDGFVNLVHPNDCFIADVMEDEHGH